jgi:hypothetical protein
MAANLLLLNTTHLNPWTNGEVGEFLRPYAVSLRDVHLVALHLAADGLDVNIREERTFHGVFSR